MYLVHRCGCLLGVVLCRDWCYDVCQSSFVRIYWTFCCPACMKEQVVKR
ncbi:uncharacterized protein J3R85_003007 [Psidium guajava]|nr:uncharacterized protein J3R85_003007 [Psidium guajava]